MRWVVIQCRTCGKRWVDGDGLWAEDVECTCPCPPELEAWQVLLETDSAEAAAACAAGGLAATL